MSRFLGPRTFSIIQLIAGAAAAATAALVASMLGVAGTVVGAALASAAITILAAIYDHSMRKAREKVLLGRNAVTPPASAGVQESVTREAAGGTGSGDDDHYAVTTLTTEPLRLTEDRGYRWGHIAVTALLIMGLAIAGITVLELATGRPISALWSDSAR